MKRRMTRMGPKRTLKKRTSKYVLPKDAKIDYKNLSLLQRYLTDRGKLLSRRITGIKGKDQRDLTQAVKRARYLGLISVGSSKRR